MNEKRDCDYECWGFDLDGVFLQDVDPQLYLSDLPRALQLRHQQQFVMPRLVLPPNMVIVTGRLVTDRDNTLTWLKPTLLHGKELHMREHKQIEPCEFKIQTARRLKLSHFVESHPEEAIRIAAALPQLRVMHYDFTRGEGTWLTAL